MKYFTKSWHEGKYSEERIERIRDSYWKHLETIQSRLPESVLFIAKNLDLHDSLFRKITYDSRNKLLFMGLRCGDSKSGYFDFDLEYGNVVIAEHSLNVLNKSIQNPRTEILYDEIDVQKKMSVHRFLLWPYQEFEIVFSQLSYVRRPALDRKVNENGERFIAL